MKVTIRVALRGIVNVLIFALLFYGGYFAATYYGVDSFSVGGAVAMVAGLIADALTGD